MAGTGVKNLEGIKRLNRFERAVRAHEMRGAMHPGDWDRIDAEYEAAKANLKERLK